MTKGNPEQAREGHLRRTYGITSEQYQELYKRQEGRCAVCQKHQDELTRRLAVDHDHHTLEIRGLLCGNCNHRVVGKHTDPELLRRVADYVSQGTGWFTPPKKKRVRRSRAAKGSVAAQSARKVAR